MNKFIYLLSILALSLMVSLVDAQNVKTELTKDKILSMDTEQLSALSLEDLMAAIDIVGVSSLEELYELLLNKDVVSASKKSESQFDSPLSTTVLSSEEILSSGATSIEEALRLVPGVIVREKTNGNYDVHIRGLDNIPPKNMMVYSENSSTLVMIDGRPVFNYAMGGILWETLPVTIGDVDRIEVVRGPASALYGPNAVSGAINIITKSIESSSPLVSGNIQGGNLSTYLGDVSFKKRVSDQFGFGISTNYEHRDRSSDKLYLFNERKSFSKSEYEVLTYTQNNDDTEYHYLDPQDDIDELFPDPGLARERYAFNGFFNYNASSNVNLNLNAGHQSSEVVTSTMGDNPTPYSGRESSTSYVDFTGSIYGFQLQTNYLAGTQDYNQGNEGFKVDVGQFNGMLEYDWQYKNLTVRPGLNYISIFYDDTPYLRHEGGGFFNGKQEMSIFAGNIRLDYTAFSKLRLVAALRSENYSHNNEWQPSWQFVASYKINDNNNVRVVYSRANKSPFLFETETNFDWDRGGRPAPNYMQFRGNKEMDLMTSDMIEVGFRSRPAKNLLVDIEAFYSKGQNFTVMSPDSTNFTIPVSMVGMAPTPVASPVITAYMNYQNIPLESTQVGASISMDWIISEKLIAKGHITVQKTTLDNFNTVTRDETIGNQAHEVFPMPDGAGGLLLQQLGIMAMSGQIPAYPNTAMVSATSDWQPNESAYENDFEHEATPSVWGSIGLDYRPTDKLNIFSNCYFYGDQTFLNQYDNYEVDAKYLLNIKASYKVSPSVSVFVNGRNILNMKSPEFAFMDEIPGMVLGGLHFQF